MQEADTAILNSAQDGGPLTAWRLSAGDPYTLHHSFATHVLEAAYDIRTIQELLGYKDMSTTTICTHVMNKDGRGIRSPVGGP